MKKILLVFLVLACLFVISGCRDKDQPETTTTTTTTTTTKKDDDKKPSTDDNIPEGKEPTSIVLDKIRVQLLSDTLVRMEVKGPKGFEDRASYTVAKRTDWEDVKYTSATEGDYTVITTSAYKIYVPANARTLKDSYITDTEGTVLWHYESDTNSNVYLPSPSDVHPPDLADSSTMLVVPPPSFSFMASTALAAGYWVVTLFLVPLKIT